ncbi:CAP domain-containing protein [Pontibacillus salipaludis]|uniref:CAP domain-containing protein n=1 Tax=Pontibacillus salipaludis TaxID=1697394 RepID=UPI0031EB2AAE
MQKKFVYALTAVLSLGVLGACNNTDTEESLNDTNNSNVERLTFENQGNGDSYSANDGNGRFNVQGEMRQYTIPGGDMNGMRENVEKFVPDQFEQYMQDGEKRREYRQGKGDGNGQTQYSQPEQNQTPNQNNQTQQQKQQAQEQKEQANKADSEFKAKVVELTNKERKKQGLPALKADAELRGVAQKKSEDMVKNDYFSHNSPRYGSPFEMMQNFGIDYKTAAENIAAGQQTPEKVVQQWMNSSGHRKNILNKNVTHIGIGIAEGGEMGIYWTQMFIQK